MAVRVNNGPRTMKNETTKNYPEAQRAMEHEAEQGDSQVETRRFEALRGEMPHLILGQDAERSAPGSPTRHSAAPRARRLPTIDRELVIRLIEAVKLL